MSKFFRKKVTYQRMGEMLAEYTGVGLPGFVKTFQEAFEGEDLYEELKSRCETEAIIFRIYTVGSVLMENFRPVEKGGKILDSYHNAIYRMMGEVLGPAGFERFKALLSMRCLEYAAALSRKEGPNPLWPLAKAVSRNILGEETLDITILFHISALNATCATGVRGLLQEFKLTDE